MKKRVYLAGPIGHLTYDEATGWRNSVRAILRHRSNTIIDSYSPMRGKAFAFQKNGSLAVQAPDACALTTARGIMTRDFNDCVNADLVFANFLGAKHVSIGTCMEMAFAYTRQIPVIAVIEEGNPHANHPMLEETFNFRVSDLDTGIEVALSFLLP